MLSGSSFKNCNCLNTKQYKSKKNENTEFGSSENVINDANKKELNMSTRLNARKWGSCCLNPANEESRYSLKLSINLKIMRPFYQFNNFSSTLSQKFDIVKMKT